MKELKAGIGTGFISNFRRNFRYAVAVISSILLIIILIEGYKFYKLSPDKLYREKFTRFELDRNALDSSAISKAYHEKKYRAVITLNRSSVLNLKDVFLTGLAYLEIRDFSKAIGSFQVVIVDAKNGDTGWKDAAEYYLALAYLQNHDYDQAIELMTAVGNNSSHPYKAKFSPRYIKRVKRLKWR